jgi:hypothetical protein
LYTAPSIIRVRWARHIALMGGIRNEYKILVGKPERKRPIRRPRCRWENNIRMGLRGQGWEGVDWMDLAQDRDQWWALVNTHNNKP